MSKNRKRFALFAFAQCKRATNHLPDIALDFLNFINVNWVFHDIRSILSIILYKPAKFFIIARASEKPILLLILVFNAIENIFAAFAALMPAGASSTTIQSFGLMPRRFAVSINMSGNGLLFLTSSPETVTSK